MPDWRSLVAERLRGAGLDPVDEIDVVEEIAQHVEDRFTYLLGQGWSEAEAAETSLRELDDAGLIKDLSESMGDP